MLHGIYAQVDLMMSDKQPAKAMAYIHDLKLFYAVFTFPENPQPAVPEQCDRFSFNFCYFLRHAMNEYFT